ncbi:unnamed protein product [Leptosia nina]|uniref:Uncharacterized protein n=1 Tax=Leptosia nina TaxID=320188 RepID=A0AAV1K1J8_9NEOP
MPGFKCRISSSDGSRSVMVVGDDGRRREPLSWAGRAVAGLLVSPLSRSPLSSSTGYCSSSGWNKELYY